MNAHQKLLAAVERLLDGYEGAQDQDSAKALQEALESLGKLSRIKMMLIRARNDGSRAYTEHWEVEYEKVKAQVHREFGY
jgi:hypothetical protein